MLSGLDTRGTDVLRRAAVKIRRTAAFATEGPWQIDHPTSREVVRPARDETWTAVAREQEVVVYDSGFTNDADAKHVALWSPDVAELVAKVLEYAAGDVFYPVSDERPELVYDHPTAKFEPPLVLARRILEEGA